MKGMEKIKKPRKVQLIKNDKGERKESYPLLQLLPIPISLLPQTAPSPAIFHLVLIATLK